MKIFKKAQSQENTELIQNQEITEVIQKMEKITEMILNLNKILAGNLNALQKVKQESNFAELRIYTDVCKNADYTVKLVGLNQVDQFYEAVLNDYIQVLSQYEQGFKLFTSNQQKIAELNNKLSSDNQNLQSEIQENITNQTTNKGLSPSDTNQNSDKENVTRKRILEDRLNTNNAQLKIIEVFVDKVLEQKQKQLDFQLFYGDFTRYMQTKKIAIEFQNVMLEICAVKKQYDSDETNKLTGTRQDWTQIQTLYPRAINLAKQFHNIILQNIPQKQATPTQNISGAQTANQSQVIYTDERASILQKQLTALIKIMEADRKTYFWKPFSKIFKPL